MGRDRPQDAPQPALPLDPPGAEAAASASATGCLRPPRPGASGTSATPGSAQRRLLLPGHHAADERGAGLHDRRSGRHAGAPRGDCRRPVAFRSRCCPPSGRIRPWPSIARGFNAWVDRLAQASGVDVGDRFASLPGSPAQASRFLPRLRLPPFGPRPGDDLRRRFREAELRGDLRARPAAASRPTAEQVAKFQVGHALRVGPDGPRERLDAAVPPRRPAEQQHADLPTLGPDTGFDSIGDGCRRPGRWPASSTAWTAQDRLARTILYNLNPADNDLLATMMGNFQDGSIARQDAVRQRLVVPRSEGRHGAAARLRSRTMGLLEPLRGHAHRQPLLPLLHPARVFPPHPLQPAGPRDARGPLARRHGPGRLDGPGHLLPQRGAVLRFRVTIGEEGG